MQGLVLNEAKTLLSAVMAYLFNVLLLMEFSQGHIKSSVHIHIHNYGPIASSLKSHSSFNLQWIVLINFYGKVMPLER